MAQPIRMIDNANITEIFKQADNEAEAFNACSSYFDTRLYGDTPEESLVYALKVGSTIYSTQLPPPIPVLDQAVKSHHHVAPKPHHHIAEDQPSKPTKTLPPSTMLT